MKIVYIRKKSFSFDHDLEKKKKGAQSARKLDRFEGWSPFSLKRGDFAYGKQRNGQSAAIQRP